MVGRPGCIKIPVREFPLPAVDLLFFSGSGVYGLLLLFCCSPCIELGLEIRTCTWNLRALSGSACQLFLCYVACTAASLQFGLFSATAKNMSISVPMTMDPRFQDNFPWDLRISNGQFMPWPVGKFQPRTLTDRTDGISGTHNNLPSPHSTNARSPVAPKPRGLLASQCRLPLHLLPYLPGFPSRAGRSRLTLQITA